MGTAGSALPAASPAPLASAPPPPPACCRGAAPLPPGRSPPRPCPLPAGQWGVLPQGRAQKWKSLVPVPDPPPPPPPSALGGHPRGTRLAPSPGSFSGLGTRLRVHPGAPTIFVPGERTAPACGTAQRSAPLTPPRGPGGQPRARSFPRGAAGNLRRAPAAPPPGAAPALPRPAARAVSPEPGAGAGPGGLREGGGRRRGWGVVSGTSSPETATFWLPPAGQLPASGLSGTAR